MTDRSPADLRILDFSRVLAGPLATTVLADQSVVLDPGGLMSITARYDSAPPVLEES